MKIIFFDTETTGLWDKPKILQLSYIVCDGSSYKEIERKNFFFYQNEITIDSMAVHHITPKILEEKIKSQELDLLSIRQQIQKDFSEASYLVAHNAQFDKKVLETNDLYFWPDEAFIDSYKVAYTILDQDIIPHSWEQMKYNLQFLRYFLELNFSEEINPHDAMSDVIVLKEVFISLLYIFKSKEELEYDETLQYFEQLSNSPILLRKMFFGKYIWEKFSTVAQQDIWYLQWLKKTKETEWETQTDLYYTVCYYLNKP